VHTALSAIEERLDAPTSKGLAHAVSAAIRDGVLGAGDRLPPIRTVAAELALSPTTVSAAWSLLQRSGTVVTDGRRGTTVATDAARAPVGGSRYRRVVDHEGDFALDLSTGVPDPALLPDLGPALRTVTAALGTGSYLDDPVLPELAALVRRDWPVADAPLTVVDGAMDGLDLVVRTALRFGDRVVVEDPGFPALLDLLEATGVQVVGVPLDEEGVEPGALAAALRGGARAVFLQPRAQNPTGVTMTEGRAEELARLLADAECLVVEDDSAYGLSPSPLVSLGRWLPERTVHVRSFSKAYGPDLRLAALSAPPELLRAVTSRRQLGQGWTSRLLQQVLASLLSSPASRREVERAASTYAARRDEFVGRLAEHGVVVGGTEGLNAWVPVLDETAAVVRLASQGVAVAPGRPFRTAARGLGAGGHVRVTVGLVDGDVAALAEQVAAAARVGDHRGRRAR
jgi:DNA-binding transcriptional MocR family regulator